MKKTPYRQRFSTPRRLLEPKWNVEEEKESLRET